MSMSDTLYRYPMLWQMDGCSKLSNQSDGALCKEKQPAFELWAAKVRMQTQMPHFTLHR